MSTDNTIAQVAAGSAPQPNEKVATDYQALGDEVNLQIDTDLDLEDDASDLEDSSPEGKIDAAQKAGDISKAQAAQLKKTLKLKIDGKEVEETVDFSDDKKLTEYLQKAKAFDKRSNEFAQTKSQMDNLLKMLQENPEELMEKLGYDLDSFAERRLTKKVEELQKSPEQLEREKLQKELNELKSEKQKAEDEKSKLAAEAAKNEEAAKIETEISAAFQATGNILPKNDPEVLKDIAAAMMLEMRKGNFEVTAQDVVPIVEEKWLKRINHIFNNSSEDLMERLAGKGNLDRYRKKMVANKRAQGNTQTAKQIVKDTGTRVDLTEDKKPTKRYRDFFTKD